MEERHTIETRVGRLAVRVVGDGPTAVLWPSLFMDERSWDRLVPTLTQDRRLVIINGPGHGASGDPGRRYSLHDCVTAAGQVLDRLAIGGAVDWVGNAWGGHVGLRFAADRPAQCRSLITLGTPVAALSRSERRQTYPLLVVHGVLGPIELVLSGVDRGAALRPHPSARPRGRRTRPRQPAARQPADAPQCGHLDLAAPGRPDRCAARDSNADTDDHRQRPLRIHPGPGRGRRPPHPERPNRCRARRRLPCAARGADNHIDAHPRVLGTVRG